MNGGRFRGQSPSGEQGYEGSSARERRRGLPTACPRSGEGSWQGRLSPQKSRPVLAQLLAKIRLPGRLVAKIRLPSGNDMTFTLGAQAASTLHVCNRCLLGQCRCTTRSGNVGSKRARDEAKAGFLARMRKKATGSGSGAGPSSGR